MLRNDKNVSKQSRRIGKLLPGYCTLQRLIPPTAVGELLNTVGGAFLSFTFDQKVFIRITFVITGTLGKFFPFPIQLVVSVLVNFSFVQGLHTWQNFQVQRKFATQVWDVLIPQEEKTLPETDDQNTWYMCFEFFLFMYQRHNPRKENKCLITLFSNAALCSSNFSLFFAAHTFFLGGLPHRVNRL